MSEENEPQSPPRRRVGALLAFAAVAVVALVAFLVHALRPAMDRWEHDRYARRIEIHLNAIKQALGAGASPATHLQRPDRTRAEVAMAVNTALANMRFYNEADGTHHKLRALADRFDATHAAELGTEIGCLQLVAELERDFPDARDYVWFTQLREYQDFGQIPRLVGGRLVQEKPWKP